jgi:predicted dehydrogenase
MKTKIGIIGCGNISPQYFNTATRFHNIELVGCADMMFERAQARAQEYNTQAFTVDQILAHPDIAILINLTIPIAHGEIGIRALQAGKSVYNEKPLALDRAEAETMLNLAAKKGLFVGCAPDTFLGGGMQTVRKLIDDGAIGEPIAATAFMQCHGHESWHPDPDFYYQKGGGPMFDMGPYYLTALVSLIGPVKRVSGSVRKTFAQRTITSKPKYGQTITVNVDTHISGTLDFANGAIGTIVTSFDVWNATLPPIEIHGTAGSLQVPDPNSFGGPIKLFQPGDKAWRPIDLTHSYSDPSRGLGVADMALSLQQKRPTHRANGQLAYHVLDIMHAVHEASNQSAALTLKSTCERPAALPPGVKEGDVE